HLAVACQEEGNGVFEKTIDTYNKKKTVEKGLAVVGMVAGAALIVAAPLTGGSSAVVGVLFVTASAAGLAGVALSMHEQYEKEGEIKADGRLALNLLQV